MPGKHFRSQNASSSRQDPRDHEPSHARPASEVLGQAKSADDTGFDRLPVDEIPTYVPNEAPRPQGQVSQPRVYRGKVTEPPNPRRRSAVPIVVLVCLVVVCLICLGTWYMLSSGGLSDVTNTSANANTSQQSETTNTSANANTQDQEDEATVQGTTASDILAMLSTLQHNGQDVSLPTDGAEVDVLGGRVLVAFQSGDTAQNVISRMASASVALADALSQSQVADSSTASDGVSQVPAASTPGAIAASANGTAFTGVEVVALSDARYVVAAITLSSANGLSDAGEAAILSAADSYAIQGPAYAYSGLRQQGVEQSKGDAPTLLTGEALTINMTVSQATTSTSTTGTSSSQSSSSSSQSSTSGTSSSTSSSSRRNSSTSSSGTSSTGYGSRTSSRGTSSYSGTGYSGYSGGTSTYDYSDGSSSGSDSSDSSGTSADSGSDASADSGSSADASSGTGSSTAADGGTASE